MVPPGAAWCCPGCSRTRSPASSAVTNGRAPVWMWVAPARAGPARGCHATPCPSPAMSRRALQPLPCGLPPGISTTSGLLVRWLGWDRAREGAPQPRLAGLGLLGEVVPVPLVHGRALGASWASRQLVLPLHTHRLASWPPPAPPLALRLLLPLFGAGRLCAAPGQGHLAQAGPAGRRRRSYVRPLSAQAGSSGGATLQVSFRAGGGGLWGWVCSAASCTAVPGQPGCQQAAAALTEPTFCAALLTPTLSRPPHCCRYVVFGRKQPAAGSA